MVKHEPGPWEYDKEGRIFHRREPLLRYIIANMESADEANWMLVSAAPDLLSVLEVAVDHIALMYSGIAGGNADAGQNFAAKDPVVQAMRKAISKAKGEMVIGGEQ